MTLIRSARNRPRLVQLEDRCTPADLWVTETGWDPLTPGTLPYAIEQANNETTYPGHDDIRFNFTDLGSDTPSFLSTSTREVTGGVTIHAGNGGQFATFGGQRPFLFTHIGTTSESEIVGGVFDLCTVANLNTDDGGAIKLTGGQLTVKNTRFTNNEARFGGAIFVDDQGTLIVDGLIGTNPPDAECFPEQQGRSIALFKWNEAAEDGGAIEARGTVILKRGWFVGNKAPAGRGGAIDVYGDGVLSVTPDLITDAVPDVSFFENEATGNGGAINIDSNGTSTLQFVAISANTSGGSGGGLSVENATVYVSDSTFGTNTAEVAGGGISAGAAGGIGGTVHALRVTFSGNTAVTWQWTGPHGVAGTGVINLVDCVYQ